MRAFLFLIVVLFSTLVFGNNETVLIRRAHIELTGVVPSVAEMEWYQVYNKDKAYATAVDALVHRKDIHTTRPRETLHDWLMSDEFKNAKPQPFDVIPSLFFVVGMQHTACVNPLEILEAKKKLVQHAREATYNKDDAIDFMCNALMCRVSNLEEANQLSRRFEAVEALVGEDGAYLSVLEDILQLPDCALK